GAPQMAQRGILEHPPDNFHTVDFIAVDGSAYHQNRSTAAAMYNLHRQMQGGVGVQFGHRHFHCLAGTRFDLSVGNHKRCPRGHDQPLPLVRVFQGLWLRSIQLMIMPATFLPVAFSMPSSPGDELTSITSGPRLDRSRSTPATLRPMGLAAVRAG